MSPQSSHRVGQNTLRVWYQDMPALKEGLKTEYRQISYMPQPNLLAKQMPQPLLVWGTNFVGKREEMLMVCLEVWRERLMALSETSVTREGFQSVDEFKRYWLLRTGERVRPLQWVNARHLRPWGPGDDLTFGRILLTEMYGDAAREALKAQAQD